MRIRGDNNGRRGSAAGTFVITLLLVIAVGVFAYSGWRLFHYYMAYKQGSDEYSELNEEYVKQTPPASAGQAAQNQGGSSASTEAAGTQEQSSRETAAAKASARQPISDLTLLEDPDLSEVAAVLDGAYRESVVENGETKELPKLVNPVNFEQLQKVNPEVIGWIRIGAVGISYPIAQAKDNEYYLHRTFKKVDNFAGCIFENCANSPFFTDQNTIIYGHNMKNGSMFGKLKDFSDQETLDRNPYFWIFTKDFIYQYRIISSSVVNKIGDPYITRFSQEDYQKFIDKSIASSEVDCGDIQVTTDDRIVTLSTCTGNDATRRILQGVLTQVYLPA